MEANQIIQAFTEVVRNQDYVFSPFNSPLLVSKIIAGIETEPSEVVAEAIRQWYLEHEDVRDAVLLEEREIVRVPRTKPENEENTLENRYQLLQEELEKLKEKKMKSNGLTYRELQFQTLKFLLKPKSP
jgi:response regulator RpfG family c-di-GMP phosphodiesterase